MSAALTMTLPGWGAQCIRWRQCTQWAEWTLRKRWGAAWTQWTGWTEWTPWTWRWAPRVLAATPSTDPELKPHLGTRAKKKLSRAEREEALTNLVDRFLGGNEDAFNQIAELVRDQVYAIAWRYAGNRDDALDILQNVLLRMFRALPKWRAQCRFTTWVHRIALNASVDFFRRHAKHETKRLDPEEVKKHEEGRGSSDPFLGVSAETPRHAAQRREVLRRVRAALPALSEMQRQCFVLRHFHAMPLEEIAEVAGCSEGSVKRHLFRATRRLRELLADLESMLESGALSPNE